MWGVFWIDANNVSMTYDQMACSWAAAPVPYRKHYVAAGFGATLLELTKAIAFGQAITLYDADLTATELRASGIEPDWEAHDLVGPLAEPSAEGLRQALNPDRASSSCQISLFTSGTTGRPKRVTHRLESIARGVRVHAKHARDVWGFAYSPTHIAGIQVFLQAVANGNTIVDLFKLPAAQVRSRIIDHAITRLSATPTFYRLLMEDPEPIPCVRSVTLGGERSDEVLLNRLRNHFPDAQIRNIYASTEAGTLLISDGEYFRMPDDVRRFVRINDGQLEIHRSLTGLLHDGSGCQGNEWYPTGDVVEVDPESPQRFRILGREREWINVGGSKVNPGEVEAVLMTHGAVSQARVFGRRNSVTGQIVCAEVVVAHGAGFDEAAILRYAARHLQDFKVPRILTQVAEIALTRTGKLKRND